MGANLANRLFHCIDGILLRCLVRHVDDEDTGLVVLSHTLDTGQEAFETAYEGDNPLYRRHKLQILELDYLLGQLRALRQSTGNLLHVAVTAAGHHVFL